MSSIQINRGTKAEIDNTPVTDGLICFQTDDNFIYMDNGDTRKAFGGVKVIPNPQEEPTEVLRNLQIADDVYKISGGHEIEDQSGTTLTQRDVMRFTGAYSHDDSTSEVTKIDIVREMTVAQKDALTGDEIEGFQYTTNENDELPLTTDWVEYRDGQSATEALDGITGSMATIEISPSTHAYSVDDYLVYNSKLYKVKASIAIGDSLVVGTNIEAVTITDAIDSLDADDIPYDSNNSVKDMIDNIVYISYTLSANADQTDIPYPTGLNNTNCMMLSFNIEGASGNDIFRMGEGAFSSSFQRIFAILNPDVISIYTSEQLLREKKVRIVLLKI